MSSLHTKSAIDLTKTPFQLHDILSYAGSEITFIRQAPTGDWNIFMVARWKMWSPTSVKKMFPSRRNTKTRSFSRRFFAWKWPLLLRNDGTNQMQHVKALKYRVAKIAFTSNVDSSLSLETWRNIFFFHAVSTKPSRSHTKSENKPLVSAMRPRYSWQFKPLKTWRR